MESRTDEEIKGLYAVVIHCLLKRNNTEHIIFESEEWQSMKNKSITIMYRVMQDGGFELKTCESGEKLQN